MTQVSPGARTAGIVAIGDELLAGAHPDLNSPFIAARLLEHGWQAVEVRAVGDDEAAIADAVRGLARNHRLVFVSGGLGPTEDDVTRHGVARAAGGRLVHSATAWAQIEEWYSRSGRSMPESNRRQALVPESAVVVPNAAGTAPGFRVGIGGATAVVLPGPPREVHVVWEREVSPWLAGLPGGDGERAVRKLVFADLSESVFADGSAGWLERGANPLVGVTVKAGVLHCRVVARAASLAEAQALADARARDFVTRFPDHLVSDQGLEPAAALAGELLARGLSVTTAESCTGGLVAGALTSVPGISAVFTEAFVTYSNAAKAERLGVPPALLEAHGAVSEEVVAAMATGAAERCGARLALAVSGVAGPDGGTPEKPVGLVWFGVALDGVVRTVSRRYPDAGRERVRAWAVVKALAEGLRAVRG